MLVIRGWGQAKFRKIGNFFQATGGRLRFVMAGLVPAIHDLPSLIVKKDVDARDKPGHDELRASPGMTS
jgi:hypothetical protein